MIVKRFGNVGVDVRFPLKIRSVVGTQLFSTKFLKYVRNGGVEVDGWFFSLEYGILYLKEREEWRSLYLPPWSLKGKTVLDVGAGCGESAKFFLDNGAFRVVAVEPNRECWPYLEKNAESHSMHIVEDPFNPSMMLHDFDYDFVKMDIEGYESLLIPYLDYISVPMAVECHNKYVCDRFFDAGFTSSQVRESDYQVRGKTMILNNFGVVKA